MVAHAVWKPASLVYDSLSSHWAEVGLGWIFDRFDGGVEGLEAIRAILMIILAGTCA